MTFTLPLRDWTVCESGDLSPVLRISRGDVHWSVPSAAAHNNSVEDPCWAGDTVSGIRLVRDATENPCPKKN